MAFLKDIRLLLLLVLVNSGSGFQYIYLAINPGEGGELRGGLYGGLLNTSDLGAGTDLYQAGFTCMKFQDTSQTSWVKGLKILSTNYDPISETVMLQTVSESGRNHVSLGIGFLCGYVMCEAWPLTSYLLDVNSLSRTIGPIAYYDSDIYFISKYHQTGVSEDYEVLELRKVETCNTMFPMKGKTLDFDLCSSLVAVVLNASVPNDQSVVYKPGNNMYKIVSSSSLQFFIQIFQVVDGEMVDVSLYEVSAFAQEPNFLYQGVYGEPRPPGRLLDTAGGLGGSAFKDNRLCWSSLRQVHCAWWTRHGDGIEDTRTVLSALEITAFCGPSSVNQEWIVRDVALADTFHPIDQGRDLYMYFSCLNMNSGASGHTGLLRMTEGNNKWFYTVTSGGVPVSAAGLFLQRQPSRHCPLTPPTTPVGGGGDGNGGPPTPPENIGYAMKSSMIVLGLGLLVQVGLYIYIHFRHNTLASANLGQRRDGPPPDIHLD